jgi:hypothetical protein
MGISMVIQPWKQRTTLSSSPLTVLLFFQLMSPSLSDSVERNPRFLGFYSRPTQPRRRQAQMKALELSMIYRWVTTKLNCLPHAKDDPVALYHPFLPRSIFMASLYLLLILMLIFLHIICPIVIYIIMHSRMYVLQAVTARRLISTLTNSYRSFTLILLYRLRV